MSMKTQVHGSHAQVRERAPDTIEEAIFHVFECGVDWLQPKNGAKLRVFRASTPGQPASVIVEASYADGAARELCRFSADALKHKPQEVRPRVRRALASLTHIFDPHTVEGELEAVVALMRRSRREPHTARIEGCDVTFERHPDAIGVALAGSGPQVHHQLCHTQFTAAEREATRKTLRALADELRRRSVTLEDEIRFGISQIHQGQEKYELSIGGTTVLFERRSGRIVVTVRGKGGESSHELRLNLSTCEGVAMEDEVTAQILQIAARNAQ